MGRCARHQQEEIFFVVDSQPLHGLDVVDPPQ